MKSKSFVIGLGVSALVLASGSAFAAADLLFSLNHNDLPASGAIDAWTASGPLGATLTPIKTWTNTKADGTGEWGYHGFPVAETVNGVKWERNTFSPNTYPNVTGWQFDGFRLPGPGASEAQDWWPAGSFGDPINVKGASIVMAVTPMRTISQGPWQSMVDIFRDELVLGIDNSTGKVEVTRKGNLQFADSATALADGKSTVLSIVVQEDGAYKVWAGGVQIMDIAGGTEFAMSSLIPGHLGNEDWRHYINIGRNNNDGWSVFNGLIGDTYVYGSALTDAERIAMEANVASSMGMSTVPEPGSILAMMSGLIGLAGFATRRKRA